MNRIDDLTLYVSSLEARLKALDLNAPQPSEPKFEYLEDPTTTSPPPQQENIELNNDNDDADDQHISNKSNVMDVLLLDGDGDDEESDDCFIIDVKYGDGGKGNAIPQSVDDAVVKKEDKKVVVKKEDEYHVHCRKGKIMKTLMLSFSVSLCC